MLSNGHYLVIDRAVRHVGHPLPLRWRKAVILGAFREDDGYIPLLGIVFPKLSATHFYRPGLPGGYIPFLTPGAPFQANRFLERAVSERRAGRTAAAFVALGRACHMLVDMACPTHAQRTGHTNDPYEWWVEANKRELEALPVPAVADREQASDLVRSLAAEAQPHRADATTSLPGMVLRRLGLIRPVTAAEAGAQARVLVPSAIGHTAALIRLFLRRTEAGAA